METQKSKQKQIAFVTGASTGIGRAIAVELGNNGYQTVIVGRSIDKLKKTKDEIEKNNGLCNIYSCDLQIKDQVTDTCNRVKREIGNPDVIINCAGAWHNSKRAYYGKDFSEININEIMEVMNVGIIAPMLIINSFLPEMTLQRDGSIVNISGTFINGANSWVHCYVSKKALEDFTKGLSQEVGKYGINVNCIAPADTKTEASLKFFTEDAKKGLEPTEISKLALHLVSGCSRNLTGNKIVTRKQHTV